MAIELKTSHFINNLENAVRENLLGIVKSNDEIQLISDYNIVIRKDLSDFNSLNLKRKVALISGGGSGHEPFSASYVSKNGLDASVSGEIFSSPSSISILTAIQQFPKDIEILLILINYTGDRLNFGLAAEQARFLGYKIEIVIVADDCAFYDDNLNELNLQNSDENFITNEKLGTRGLAGVYLAIKIANILIKKKLNIYQVKKSLENILQLLTTYSVSLNSCNIPGIGTSFKIDELQMELGLGVHGELGVKRANLESLHSIMKRMIYQLIKTLTKKISKRLIDVPENELGFVVLINNLGGLSNFELNMVKNELIEQLNNTEILIKPENTTDLSNQDQLFLKRLCRIERIFYGSFLTSFSMHAVSITLIPILNKDDLIDLIDSANLSNFSYTSGKLNDNVFKEFNQKQCESKINESFDNLSLIEPIFRKALIKACQNLLHAKDELNILDSELGDSDCGTTMANMASSLLTEYLRNNDSLKYSFYHLAHSMNSNVGGTSGAIYSLLFTGMSKELTFLQNEHKKNTNSELCLNSFKLWGQILEKGVQLITKYSFANLGDRTLIDVLKPISEYLIKIDENQNLVEKYKKLDELSILVDELTNKTAELVPKCGRASYAANRINNNVDPGAKGVYYWLNAILDTIKETKPF